VNARVLKIVAIVALLVALVGGVVTVSRTDGEHRRIHVTAYFANTNGVFVGDDVRILGMPVGKIVRIEPEPERAKVTFWIDDRYRLPASVNAVVISPSLIAVRAIELTPAYSSGAVLTDNAVIPQARTAVPVEYDDLREQLQRLSDTLQPTTPGGVSTLGQFVNTAADNLRGQGTNIHDTLIKLSQAFSALGDHSSDVFATVKNLSILVSALQSSHDLLRQLNDNLAAVTGLLSNDPNEISTAISDLNGVIADVRGFVADNKEALGTTSDKLASVTTALNQSLDDVKQTLHIAPTAFQNFLNIYQPAQATLTGALAVNNFANPVSFLCSAIQAASRLGAEQSAKLCVQYLAPIIKNRQYNFLPLGENLFVGATARPNEVTYSEDWMRPDYVPPSAQAAGVADPAPESVPPAGVGAGSGGPPPLPAEAQQTDPAMGLPGMMTPPGAGS